MPGRSASPTPLRCSGAGLAAETPFAHLRFAPVEQPRRKSEWIACVPAARTPAPRPALLAAPQIARAAGHPPRRGGVPGRRTACDAPRASAVAAAAWRPVHGNRPSASAHARHPPSPRRRLRPRCAAPAGRRGAQGRPARAQAQPARLVLMLRGDCSSRVSRRRSLRVEPRGRPGEHRRAVGEADRHVEAEQRGRRRLRRQTDAGRRDARVQRGRRRIRRPDEQALPDARAARPQPTSATGRRRPRSRRIARRPPAG